MKWEAHKERHEALEYYGYIAGARIACCFQFEEGVWAFKTRAGRGGGDFESAEAAMQAAESAVREWLGKAVVEVMEPVAYGMPVSNAPPYDRLLAVEVRKPDHPGGAMWVPLFILPEGAR